GGGWGGGGRGGAAGAVSEGDVAVLPLYFWMRLAPELAHRLDHLGEPAAVARVVVAEAAAIGVEGQPADTGDEVAVGDELAALPLRTEAEILERDQHRDREAVVDGHVLHVGRRLAGLGEGSRPRH